MKQPDRAEASLKEAIDRFPEHALVYAELARFYLHTHTNLPASRSLAQRAVTLEPNAANYFVLGRACEANGDISSAAQTIEQALALEPNDAQYKDFYAYIRSRQ